MATDSTKADSKKTQDGTETTYTGTGGAPVAAAAGPVVTTAVLLKRAKGKDGKKRKKYSRGTKGLQRLALGVSKAAFRGTNAVSEGFRTFSERSSKSGRKRRDGLVRDAIRNVGRGLGDGLSELSKAPEEITRKVGTGRVWKAVRLFSIGG